MQLKTLSRHQNTVAALCTEGDGKPDVIKWLQQLPANMQGSARGFVALFDRYAQSGRQQLGSEHFHVVDEDAQIWEFIKGRLRIMCFMDGGNLVILTHGLVKKTQKVDSQEVAHAISLKQRFLSSKA